jgi:hypothetical protein
MLGKHFITSALSWFQCKITLRFYRFYYYTYCWLLSLSLWNLFHICLCRNSIGTPSLLYQNVNNGICFRAEPKVADFLVTGSIETKYIIFKGLSHETGAGWRWCYWHGEDGVQLKWKILVEWRKSKGCCREHCGKPHL